MPRAAAALFAQDHMSMPPCDDHYQSVPNTTTKCQKKRDRGDRTDVHFFSEDRLFVHAFHDRPGEPSVAVAAPPTYKSARGASPAVEDLPGDGLRRAERRCARPPPSPSTFSPLLGGDPVAPVFCACSSLTCAAARSPGLWIWSAKCLRQRRRCARTCDVRARAQAQAQAQAQAHAGSG